MTPERRRELEARIQRHGVFTFAETCEVWEALDDAEKRVEDYEARFGVAVPDGKVSAESHCATCERCQAYRQMADEEARRHAERATAAESRAAEAERRLARAVAALRQIEDVSADRAHFVMMGPRAFARAEQIARAALAEIEGRGKEGAR